MTRKVILYIATSLDGFIAKKNGNLDWLTKYESTGEDYGFTQLCDRIGAVCVGGATFRQVEDTYMGKEAYVFTRTPSSDKAENIHFVDGDVKEVVKDIQNDIWLVGGGVLVNQFLEADLIDEYIVTVVPILLGEGIPLFPGKNPESRLTLSDVKHYPSGMVQLHYLRHPPRPKRI